MYGYQGIIKTIHLIGKSTKEKKTRGNPRDKCDTEDDVIGLVATLLCAEHNVTLF